MTLRPTHALARQASERRDTFGGCLRIWGVDDLVALRVEPKGELPVLRETAAPTELPQQTRPDHVGGTGDHLHRAKDLLEGTLDHVTAGILGAHGRRQPALALVEDVPLITLHRADLGDETRPRVSVGIEVMEQIPENIRERYGVGIKDGDEFRSRVHGSQGIGQCATLESIPGVTVNDGEAIDLLPWFEDRHRPVRRVVHEDDLVVRVVQPGAGLEQAGNNPLFVVGRDVNRDKRLVTERQPFGAIAIGMLSGDPAATHDPSQSADVSRLALPRSAPVPAGTKEGEQEHRRRGQVVLKGVREEERAHPERDQRQFETEPVEKARIARAGEGDACRGAADDGKDGERRDKDGDENEKTDEPAP